MIIGILQRTTDAKEKTERAEIIENAQMDILGKQAENHGSLSADELEKILISADYNTQGRLSNEESILDRTLTSKDGKYTIPVSEIYNGTLDNKKTVEATDYSENVKTKLEIKDNASAYVEYNGILCRVLYDASSPYGIEIISNDIIKTGDTTDMVPLGSADINEKVKASDFDTTGITGDVSSDEAKKAAVSYNMAIDTLNEKAESYRNKTDGIVKYARCVGSNPENPNDISNMDESVGPSYGYGNKFKETSSNALDMTQMNTLNLNIASDTYWLAARMLAPIHGGYYLMVMTSSSSDMSRSFVCSIDNNGKLSGYAPNCGFRPVFHLSYGVKIKDGGDGTLTKPYVLE